MTTSLVQLTEEDLGFELLAVLRKIEDPSTDIDAAQLMELAGSEDIEHADLIIEQDYYSLLNEAFFTFPVEKILSCSAEDLDKLFSLVFLVISKIGASKRRAVAPKLMNIITKDHTQHSKTKLNLATILFNRLPESDKYNALRLKLIQSIFAYAVTANLSSLLAQHLNDVERWVKEWKLEGQDCVDLYVSAITLSAAVGNKKYTQKITMQYLAFLNGGEAKQLQEAHDAASTCIVNAILSENTRELDQLFRLDVVTSMKDSSDAKHQLVFELVSIFVEGDVALFIPFGTKNADALTALGFDYDTLLSEMRTLTICSLGSDNPIVSFETLQSSLQLSDSIAVEKAVITAVMTGKVDAEIDQENDQVVVKKASIRTFREAEWVKLSEKLANWKQDVAHVLHTLSLAQSSDGGNDM